MPRQHIHGTNILVLLEDPIVAKVEKFQAAHKLASRTEALRVLVALGLKWSPQEDEITRYMAGRRA